MPVSLNDQNVLVLGASSVIGRDTAVLFAREGARVVASARREERLRQLQEQLQKEGHPIEILPADASNTDDMSRLAEFARTKLGPLDIMVYVSGTNTPD